MFQHQFSANIMKINNSKKKLCTRSVSFTKREICHVGLEGQHLYIHGFGKKKRRSIGKQWKHGLRFSVPINYLVGNNLVGNPQIFRADYPK